MDKEDSLDMAGARSRRGHGERTVHLVSLGCPKNLVDSETVLGRLVAGGYRPVERPDDADVIVVNTCAFITEATEESIQTILELARQKESGRCNALVVVGCMVQRYAEELAVEFPEVDYFLGTGELDRIREVLETPPPAHVIVGEPGGLPRDNAPRVRANAAYSAYLKISEGCNQKCSFCIIPELRGRLRSRRIDGLVAEARGLAAQGVVELNVVSQDTNAYGADIDPPEGRPPLARLLRELSHVDGLSWIRLLYMYPKRFPAALMDVVAREPAITKYIDMPLQHINDRILRRMGRGVGGDRCRRIVDMLRDRIPGLVLRTTFMVGFPGETDAEFQELLDYVAEARFEHAGVFIYSAEEGTPAARLPGQIPEAIKVARKEALMEAQRAVSRRYYASLVGTVQNVLVEGYSEETDLLLQGRMSTQAPDVDGHVLINEGTAMVGTIVPVEITQSLDYDVIGRIVGEPGATSFTV